MNKNIMQTTFEVLTKKENTILIKTSKVWIRISQFKNKNKNRLTWATVLKSTSKLA